ncbi:MAG: Holliday junction resolvase RuvX, partial [Egibacteraceae bacterium]
IPPRSSTKLPPTGALPSLPSTARRVRPEAPPVSRYPTLGVDVGTVRVGLAISDPAGLVATPLDTIAGGADLVARLAAVARARMCQTVVVGLPRALSGRDTASTASARAVADGLRDLGLSVQLWDERLSSVEAERVLLRAGVRRAARKVGRDRIAATIILQGWLDAQPGGE